ncbi:hypothetical protein BH11ACT3_BH11ACT3_03830 [soil metagenome]
MTRAAITTVAALALLLSACAGTTSTPLPAGVSVTVYQARSDVDAGKYAIRVTNDTDAAITITKAVFDSAAYTETMAWKNATARVPAGGAVDLRILAVPAVCTRDDRPDVVDLGFTLADGRTGTAEVEPGDPYNQFPKLPDQDCLAQNLDATVAIASARIDSDGIVGSPGRLVLSLTPSGDDSHAATLDTVRSTILISLLDADGVASDALPQNLTLSGTGEPSELGFAITPAGRCDPHAVAEDKVGTLFPIEVTVDGVSGRIRLPASQQLRGQVYAFVESYCGY